MSITHLRFIRAGIAIKANRIKCISWLSLIIFNCYSSKCHIFGWFCIFEIKSNSNLDWWCKSIICRSL